MSGAPGRPPVRAMVDPATALREAAAALDPPYRAVEPHSERTLTLRDPAGVLPDLALGFERERRLFSRTRTLVVRAEVPGAGPDGPVTLTRRPPRWGRRDALVPSDPAGAPWAERFAGAGLLDGAARMTNVQELTVAWDPATATWSLRLLTLAGALIGTGPSAVTAVPLERDDVEGVVALARALAAGAAGG